MEFTTDQLLARANELRQIADRIDALAKKQAATGVETQELLPWLRADSGNNWTAPVPENSAGVDVIL
jgi:hypothetical protein